MDPRSSIINYRLPITHHKPRPYRTNPIRIPAIVSMYDGHVLGGGSSLGILSSPTEQ